MSKFLKIFAPAAGGAAGVLTMAYVLADQFVVDMPAPVRGLIAVAPATAQEAAAEKTATDEAAPAADVAESEDAASSETEMAAEEAAPDQSEMAAEEAAPAAMEMAADEPAAGHSGGFGLGRTALPVEIAAWDIDVRPDGTGLPAGSGDVWTGEEVFVAKCASCHGDFGEAVGRWPVLAGGWDTLDRRDPVKTIGSYWPYLSTVYDYVNRAMPFGEAQSLEPDEIYAITAYLLYLNNIVEDDFELSNENFLAVEMPNAGGFFMDDRPETELAQFAGEVCMENCKESVEITMRAAVLDVTPGSDEEPTEAVAEAAADVEYADGEVTEEQMADGTDGANDDAPADATEMAAAAETPDVEATVVSADPALLEAGEGVFRQCRSCHAVGEGAANKSGPQLNNLVGRTIGVVDGFRYSNAFKDAHDAGDVWTMEALTAFLANPREAMPGTKMSFRGLGDQSDIDAVIAYLEDASAK